MAVNSLGWLIASAFLLFLTFTLSTANIRLQSPTVTEWGDWGPVSRCPNSTYVIGVQLKVAAEQPPLHDDTGLNGIRFFCSDIR